jgi:hypothetical protein
MSVIDVLIEPERVTRVLFDCRDAAPDPADQWRIEQGIARAIALARFVDDAQETLLPTARHGAASPL